MRFLFQKEEAQNWKNDSGLIWYKKEESKLEKEEGFNAFYK